MIPPANNITTVKLRKGLSIIMVPTAVIAVTIEEVKMVVSSETKVVNVWGLAVDINWIGNLVPPLGKDSVYSINNVEYAQREEQL